ncbi:MAG: phosphatidylserine/phosphatidylglycerophosphate/cardiolipin synthase family protein [Geobacter sp.]
MAVTGAPQGRVARLIRRLGRRAGGMLPASLQADQVVLYPSGERFFDALFAALQQAQRLICLEYYIIRADRTGGRLAALLADAVQRGVQVFLIYDAVGCLETPEAYFSSLRRQGVQCLAFNPLSLRKGLHWFDRRDHRKLTLIDGQLAFLGGLNIGDEYAGLLEQQRSFHDVGFSLRGAAVTPLVDLFAETWLQEKGSRPLLPALDPPPPPAAGAVDVSLVSGSPQHLRSSIRATFRVAMASATEELLIVNPYFIPGPRIMRSLLRAARRQVRVRLLLPARSDVPLVRLVSHSTYESLLKAGIEIFELERQLLHAKLMLIDGERTVLGSANLDQRSFHRNYEINAVIRSREFGRQVRALIEQDLAGSRAVSLDDHVRRGLLQRLLEWLFRPLCWFL